MKPQSRFASPAMTPIDFALKWEARLATATERGDSHEHFIDLCRVMQVETPNERGSDDYRFEKPISKNLGGKGFADAWMKGHFGWEYKGPGKDLKAGYRQLLDYREDLENPPLLVVCDFNRFEVHTNFTASKKKVYEFKLADLKTSPAEALRVLRALFENPRDLLPTQTREELTEAAASDFADLAGRLQSRGHDPLKVAHFLNRLLFCLFAEDVSVLPRGLLTRILKGTQRRPDLFNAQLRELFQKMSTKGGGFFGTEFIEWFNGGLFQDDEVLELDANDLRVLEASASLDWSKVEPAILGTLFERGLDPKRRGQLGAHYTDREKILLIVEPVVMAPLRREFAEMKKTVSAVLAKKGGKAKATKCYRAFLDRLRAVTVLDPACGSGNFLYVTLQLLHDLEREVILWGSQTLKLTQEFPGVGPHVVHGIEINAYAAELARVTIWIGELQWMIANGYSYATNPILKPLETVKLRDAVLTYSAAGKPMRPDWPAAEFIIGNPPFIGGKLMKENLGDEYVEALFRAWKGHVPREADFVLYWHERARELIEKGSVKRAGLISTQGIRTGANLKVLQRVKETGDIFMAWQDEPWVVEGADVRVSIVGQDDGSETERVLDGQAVEVIHANLVGGSKETVDVTAAASLDENLEVAFMGDTKGGAFDLDGDLAREMLAAGPNPNGRPNSDVIVPWMNTSDLVKRPRGKFIIDFGLEKDEATAARYEVPFEYLAKHVKPEREKNKRPSYAKFWWVHVEPRPKMREKLAHLARFIVTPTTSKYRLFAWERRPMLPDHQLIVIARSDDYALGVLHSRIHEAWSLAKIGRKGVGNDPVYAPTFAFENFPFPWPLNTPDSELTDEQSEHRDAIAAAAKALDEERSRWLNPPELIRAVPDVVPALPHRLEPVDVEAKKKLQNRTLTKLYNERPTWLKLAHEKLDRAVFAAYGWPEDMAREEVLSALLMLNLQRAKASAPAKKKQTPAAQRKLTAKTTAKKQGAGLR